MGTHSHRQAALMRCVKQGASDLHITVGQPPVLRLHGRLQKLEDQGARAGRHGGADEEHHARPLPAGIAGGGQLRTSASPSATMARFRVSIFKQRGNVGDGAAADSRSRCWTMEELGAAAGLQEPDHAAARAGARHGPDRLGQDARRWPAMVDYLNDNVDHHIITIEDPIEFYHNAQEVDDQPARGGRRRAVASPRRFAARCGRTRT